MAKKTDTGTKLFRSDAPPVDLDAGRDAFGHKAYAAALASALLEADVPYTFGLFGPFGLGKTTVIEEIGRLVKGSAALVIFDAWRYADDALRRQFIRECAQQLNASGQITANDAKALIGDFDTTETQPGEQKTVGIDRAQVIQLVGRLLIAALLIWIVWQVIPEQPDAGNADEYIRLFISALITIGTFALLPLSQIVRVREATVSRGELKPELFGQRFSDTLAKIKANRLIVAIDNLDRCSPERIEELFFTLSTFLEPISKPGKRHLSFIKERKKKEAVFLIAADADALRRHLRLRETQSAVDSGAPRDDIGQYADDYLRKIVKASLTMKPIIADDMRAFVSQQLTTFSAARSLSDEDSSLLVELVASALRHNPRRVKEFIADLELQLRFIEGREKTNAIVGHPSGDVLLAAKLLLLEEEWPGLYRRVRADYRVLAAWHEDIPAGRLGELPDDPRFLSYMNTSRSVSDANLRVFLRLKQSASELELPEYESFREALIGGLRDEVQAIIEGSSVGADRYADASVSILGEELDRKFLAGARNVIEVVTSSEELMTSAVGARRFMARVANHHEVRVELGNSAPAPILLAANKLLDDTLFDHVAETFVGFVALIGNEPDRVGALLSAFIPLLSRLSPRRRDELAANLATLPEETPLFVFKDIATADAALVPDEVGARALREAQPEFDVSGEAFLVLSPMLRRSPSASVLNDAFLSAIAAHITETLADPTAVDGSTEISRLERLGEDVRLLESASENAADELMSTINANFDATMQHDWQDAMLDLIAPAAQLGSESNANSTVSSVLTHYRDADHGRFLAFLRSRAAELPRRFGLIAGQVLHGLLDNVSASEDERLDAASLIAEINHTDGEGLLGDATRRIVERGELQLATTLRDRYPERIRTSEHDIATTTLNRAEAEVPEISGATIDFLTVILPDLDETELDRVQSILDSQVESGDEEDAEAAFTAADRFASVRAGFDERRANVIRRGFDSVASSDDPPVGLVESLASRADAFDRDRRDSLIAQTARWIGMPSVEQGAIGRAATHLPGLSADERFQLVAALVEAETAAVGSVDLRESLLRSALTLMGRRNTRASNRVDARMAAIGTEGGDENADLLNRLNAVAEEGDSTG